ncbi:MAG: GTP pyrophosphokinase [Spirochaetes bacterium ADurb.Bin218]|jgi:(p)ppGpp synthase/HD superfamily hydrolase|nr:bifunctional (p)ppGpp synthetase/guanosine-3',5'-bis(diphosphate) 3'-pyrophosphohydrolase [Spirochaetota bacterium]OQA96198.1 MAG: GTP pyrophosphokinase [Spirochaetes bacterium ADurb.Bin218]HOQ12035.1 HD domain-containing protein [Spirochaetota bacterium]HPX90171.1 HD domain-containing protein [Spirochaetota bacterium]
MIIDHDLIIKTLNFAAQAHGDQKIPGSNITYLCHLVSVAFEIVGAIFAEDINNPIFAIQCSLLHDTIEDTSVTFDDLKNTFNEKIALGVLALSKNKNLPKGLQLKDSVDRILKMPRDVAAVKLADRITNLAPPPSHWEKEKIINYREESLFILEKLGFASPFLARRLEEKIKSYGKGSPPEH